MATITHFTYHPLVRLHDEAIRMPADALQTEIVEEIRKQMVGRILPSHVYMLEVWGGFAFYLNAGALQIDLYADQRDEYPYDRLDAHTA